MKKITKIVTLVALAATLMFTVQSCNNDDKKVPESILTNFIEDFPNATDIHWDMNQGYFVADFKVMDLDNQAWYMANGTWMMTLSEMTYSTLPNVVQTSFENNPEIYGTVLESYLLQRANMLDNYLIRSQNSASYNLTYYAPDGTMLFSGLDSSVGDLLPPKISTTIMSYITSNYPNGVIAAYQITAPEDNVEVTVYNDSQYIMVIFDINYNWMFSYWAIEQADIPTVVATAYADSDYAEYPLMGTYYYEVAAPNTSFYEYQINISTTSNVLVVKNLRIDEDGNILTTTL